MQNKAFSLIELLVVVAIIAILASVAVPTYMQYRARATIANAITEIEGLAEQAIITYNRTGAFPASLTIGGVTLNNANFSWSNVVNVGNIYHAAYQVNGNFTAIEISFDIKGLQGITGYVDPSGAGWTGNPQNAAIRWSAQEINKVMTQVCGQFVSGGAGQDIPFGYLPNNCQCAAVGTWFNSGTGC